VPRKLGYIVYEGEGIGLLMVVWSGSFPLKEGEELSLFLSQSLDFGEAGGGGCLEQIFSVFSPNPSSF
jgi:hypothetical protein